MLLLIVLGLFFGVDSATLLQLAVGGGGAAAPSVPATPPDAASDAGAQFVQVVLGSTEDT